ncbi:chemotaxis protein CheW [Teredinibacter sp. KSP-S5-2]|uniref:chemotaxis protein CheW n=1 Tax=Teredinibacter sp. KSP-S5-2 TaxID=3034506 RepID=UPI0029342C83|nr:chemotaxis protein CheW [Teredinibacter sp. KSP-S5-2]WNO09362.1 chemotaxis protein CheW [Teredinibacter sp. KSP-S5-2]
MTDQLAALEHDTDIPCLILPLVDCNLLLPTVTVAEMVSHKPLEKRPDAPDWFLGYFDWRNTKVPVLSYEVLNGSASTPMNPKGRIAVLNNTGINEKLPFVAIPTQGIPRLSRVGKEDIIENDEIRKRPVDLMQVKVGVEELVIPDIAALENAYLHII